VRVVFTPGAQTAKTASNAGPEMEGNGQLKVKSPDGGPCAFKASGSAIQIDNWAETLSPDGTKENGDMGGRQQRRHR
jgi:hypothetical protein